MRILVRPLTLAVSLALASSAFAATAEKSAKPAAKAPAKAAAKPAAKKAAPAPTPNSVSELEFGHNLGPAGVERVQAVLDRFNKETGGTMKLVRLERGQKPADLNLVSRYDMSEVITHPKSYVPLHDVMAKAGMPLNSGEFSADLKGGVMDAKGRLVALPAFYSTPVLFYNKAAFRKAKLDPDQPPKTWFEMQGMLDKLQEAGYACPYTTSWPVWVHIDNVSALSSAPAVSDKGQLTFNGLPQVKHLAMMITWTKANYFKHFGRRAEGSDKFREGECAMITTDSGERIAFEGAKGLELGVAPMPHHDDVYGGRQHTLADGFSLWVGAGRTPEEYKQAARFVSWLLSPEMQVEAVRMNGGLPLTPAARSAVRSRLFKNEDTKTLDVAYASMKGKGASTLPHVADIDPVRIIVNEELEAAWADKKPAKAALDTAVSRGNAVLAAKPALRRAQPF